MSEPQSQEEIQQEIEQTRERLGETVEELVAKTDVKSRAQAKVAGVKTAAQVKAAGVKAKAQDRAGALPEPVRTAGSKAAELPGRVNQSPLVQRRWPLAVVAVVAVAGVVIGWRRLKA